MAFKVDFEIFDGHERALDFAVDVRLALDRHDSTGLVRQLLTDAIRDDEWSKVEWVHKHRCFEDMCKVRQYLYAGEYPIYCKGGNRYKCRRCPVA